MGNGYDVEWYNKELGKLTSLYDRLYKITPERYEQSYQGFLKQDPRHALESNPLARGGAERRAKRRADWSLGIHQGAYGKETRGFESRKTGLMNKAAEMYRNQQIQAQRRKEWQRTSGARW